MTYRFSDIIDLEYFIQQDQHELTKEKRKTIKKRDRQIFLDEFEENGQNSQNEDRRSLIWLWLQKRREKEEKKLRGHLPGALADDAFRITRLIFGLAGLLLGVSLAFSLLNYTGEKPVNVFIYLTFIILTQLVLLIIIPISFFLKKRSAKPGLLASLSANLVIRLYQKGIKRITAGLSGTRRRVIEQLFGQISQKQTTYGSLFLWPFFLLFQLFGICFNIGVLLTSLLLITISDIGFGWQSTIQFSSQTVHQLVRYLAVPWTWLLKSGYYPSFNEIEGSRIILKEGIYSLSTAHLTSWWPFLILCVIVYGLLPRVGLMIIGIWQTNRCLHRLHFKQSSFSSIIRRMTTPIVNSSGLPDHGGPDAQKIARTRHKQKNSSSFNRPALVLIPDDLYSDCDKEVLGQLLLNNLGIQVEETQRIDNDYMAEQQLIADLGSSMAGSNRMILILAEGWMAPIEDFLSFIRQLRQTIEPKTPLLVGLIGRPTRENPFGPVRLMDFQIWQNKIDSLGDPYLSLEPIIDIQQEKL